MRIASLLPSATEILFAIDAGPEVVGVTHECDHPAGARVLPRLTSSALDHEGQMCADIDRHIKQSLHHGSAIYRLDEGLLQDLKPDLIVTQELCDVCAVSYAQVEKAVHRLPSEVPVLSLEPASLGDICATILAVGRASGHADSAEAAVTSIRRRIEEVEMMVPLAAARVVCVEWTDPVMIGGHWVPEMVRRAGGVDALGHEGAPSTYVDWETMVATDPDVLVLMPCGFDLPRTIQLATDITDRPGFSDLSCARSGRVAAVDGSAYFNRPGPRIVEGLELLAAILRTAPGHDLPAGAAWIRT
jgi:iron complex transport system substrate-binding protein